MTAADIADLEHGEIERMVDSLPLEYRLSSLVYATPALAGLALLAACGTLSGTRLGGMDVGGCPVSLAADAAGLLATAALLGFAYLRRASTVVTVHASTMTYRTGILSVFERSMGLAQIVGVNTIQAFGQRGMGIGTIQVETTGQEIVTCPRMERAAELAYLLNHLAAANRPVPALEALQDRHGHSHGPAERRGHEA